MKKILTTILISALTFYGIYNFVPQKYLAIIPQKLGATITSISLTDSVKDALYTITNTNFTNVNAELSRITGTTTIDTLTDIPNLAVIGTITTGVWNGTVIATSTGGTGLTSAISYGQMLVGNASNGYTLSATSTLGLLSPSVREWSINANGFLAPTTTIIALLPNGFFSQASSTFSGDVFTSGNSTTSKFAVLNDYLYINGVSYYWPAADGNSGDALKTDGAGNLTFGTIGSAQILFSTTTSSGTVNSTASTTMMSYTLEGGFLDTDSIVIMEFPLLDVGGNSALSLTQNHTLQISLNYGTQSITFSVTSAIVGAVSPGHGHLRITLQGGGSTSSQKALIYLTGVPSGVTETFATISGQANGTFTVDSTSNQTVSVTVCIPNADSSSDSFFAHTPYAIYVP